MRYSISRSQAFTLVELVVSITVSLILIVALLQLFSTTTTSWQRGEAQIDAFREARGALHLMARDLATTLQPTVVRADGTTNAANPSLPTLVLNRYPAPDPVRDGSAEPINEELYLLSNTTDVPTPTPANSTGSSYRRGSDLCAVGYFCQWMPDIAPTTKTRATAPHAFALMRQYLNGDGTAARIQAAVTQNGGSATSQTPLSFLQIFMRYPLLPNPPVPTIPPAGNATQLAAYIWDLKFRIDTNTGFATDGEASVPTPSAADHTKPAARYYDGQSHPYPASLPAYVEIRFKALSNTAGRRLEGNLNVNPSDWIPPAPGAAPSNFYRQFVLPSVQQFVLRVPMINSNPAPTQ